MTKAVEWRVRPVTTFELVCSYYETNENGDAGGSEVLGTYGTEEQARHAMRVFQQDEGAQDLRKEATT